MSLSMVDDNVHWMYVCERQYPPPPPPPPDSGQERDAGKMGSKNGRAFHMAELKKSLNGHAE